MTRRIGGGTAVAALAAVTFLLLFGSVLIGRRYLLDGSILYNYLPWSATPTAHRPANVATGDPVFQILSWIRLDADALLHGRLPLWDPAAMGGKPLLANDQSAPFSPFTLIAVPFDGSPYGISLGMLAKFWVAGVGMAIFARTLRISKTASAFAGLVYAASSFIVVWLGWPQGSVAALLPWVFAACEWYLVSGSLRALAGLALAIAAQFFAGHPEASVHLGVALALYLAVRLIALGRRAPVRFAGVLAAGLLGTGIAAIQVLPFVAELRQAPIVGARIGAATGTAHLPLTALSSWLTPNAFGNPGIDGLLGRSPNYVESTGFVGVAAGSLALIGAWWGWTRTRSPVAGLLVLVLFSLGTAYGPLSWLTGRLPLLALTNNVRFLMVACFALSGLAGLGFDAILQRVAGPRPGWLGMSLPAIGAMALAGLGALGLIFLRRGAAVDTILPAIRHMIGFWLVVALISSVAALAFLGAAFIVGRGRLAGAGFIVLAALEGALFAGPFNAQDPPADVLPRSDAMSWLQSHAGDSSVAALGMTMVPETPTLYGLHDVRGYDPILNPRLRLYWQRADPSYHELALFTLLENPGPAWLAAAGVKYLLVPGNTAPDGSSAVFRADGVTVAEVPDVRPFAFLADRAEPANSQQDAINHLAVDPLGPVIVEGAVPTSDTAPTGIAQVRRREAGDIDLRVSADREATLVILQSYADGWQASVDNRHVAVMRANVVFQAVTVPAGMHEVRLRYAPVSVVIGEVTTVAAITATLGILLLPVALRRRHRRLGSREPGDRNSIT